MIATGPKSSCKPLLFFGILFFGLYIVSGCTLTGKLETTDGTASTTPIPVEDVPSPPVSDPDMIVIGQPSFATVNQNNTYNPQSYTMGSPRSILKVGSRYFVVDLLNNRILVFENSLSGTPSYVLGQPDFISGLFNNNNSVIEVTAKGFFKPSQLTSDGIHMALADNSNNRVLIWNTIPTRTYQPADIVIGQADFSQRESNRGLAAATSMTLSGPAGVIYIGSKLVISDQLNNRLLVYNSTPTQNGTAADLVIGQGDFITSSFNRTGSTTVSSAKSLYWPYSLSTDGVKLLVADAYNNRVLVWNSVPTALDVDADLVIGQTSFTVNTGATTQSRLSRPRHMEIAGNSLYIADTNNSRIVYHSTFPVSNGVAATAVIGQASVTASAQNRGASTPSAMSLALPTNIAAIDGALWIADSTNSRLLKFNTLPAPMNTTEGSALAADAVWGQLTMVIGNVNQIQSPNANGFSRISGVCAHGAHVLAIDAGNQRLLVFDRSHPTEGAIAVIGQDNFQGNLANKGASSPSASSLYISGSGLDPACVFDSRGRLYISDHNNNRVLVWNQTPVTSGSSADYVIGQTNFTTSASQGCNASGLALPTGLGILNDKLIVADYGNHRSLIFDVSGTIPSTTAEVVIGAPNFQTCSTGATATKAAYPWSITLDGSLLFIVEYTNNRIMVYNTVPTTNGVPADFVIGQPDFTSALSGTTASLFLKGSSGGVRSTLGVLNGYLLVSDYYNQRVLCFDLFQLSNGMSAIKVFNQPNLSTGVGTVYPSNPSNTAVGQFWMVMGIHVFPDDDFVWFSDSIRLIRAKKSKIFNYSN